MYFVAPGNGNFRKKKSPEVILYSLCKHLNRHTRELSKGERMKANEPSVDWVIQSVLYHVFKSEFAWKICKHEIKFRHHVSHVMAYTKI